MQSTTADIEELNRQLQGYLFAQRPLAGFSRVPGRFVPVSSGIGQVPVVAISNKSQYSGVLSGDRSGLLVLPEHGPVRYKGCDVEDGFLIDGYYAASRSGQPEGGMLYANAENEVDVFLEINRMLREAGIEPAIEPLGVIAYEKHFTSGGKREQMGAAVLRMEGDTRILELFLLPVKKPRLAGSIARRIGYKTADRKRLLEKEYFKWDKGNAHHGNVLLSMERTRRTIEVSIGDVDTAGFYLADDNLPPSAPDHAFTENGYYFAESGYLMRTDNSLDTLRLVGAYATGKVPEYLVRAFAQGFRDRYLHNIPARSRISRDELGEAFDLPSQLISGASAPGNA